MNTDNINSSSTTAKGPEPPFSQNESRMTDEEMIVYLAQFSVEILEAVFFLLKLRQQSAAGLDF